MSHRACSYCHLPGHTINRCQDPAALELIRTAEFKSNIAIQYLGTGAEEQMQREISAWFRRKSVSELKVLIFAKGFTPTGGKIRLHARAMWAYYFYRGLPHELEEETLHRFICSGRYFGNVANGTTEENAYEIYLQELEHQDPGPGQAPESAELPIIGGLAKESVDCPICFETKEDIMQTNCGHLFCQPCIMTHTKGVTAACPCCRSEIDLLIVK